MLGPLNIPAMFLYGLILLAAAWQSVDSIKLTRLEVPEYADPRARTQLICAWDLAGETLQSVKWFRDERPFLEFRPQDASYIPHKMHGIYDQRCECNLLLSQCSITLRVHPELAIADYKCEVSGEGPRFRTAKGNKTMAVLALPSTGPQITGLPPTVFPNLDIHINCSSQPSLPHTTLTWLVNDQRMDSELHITHHSDGLQSTWSNLVVSISPDEAKQVECRAEQLAYARQLSLMKRVLIVSEQPVKEVSEFQQASRGSTTTTISILTVISLAFLRLDR